MYGRRELFCFLFIMLLFIVSGCAALERVASDFDSIRQDNIEYAEIQNVGNNVGSFVSGVVSASGQSNALANLAGYFVSQVAVFLGGLWIGRRKRGGS